MDKILSIIVPSYNMEAYLPKCLGSLIIDDKELLQKLDVIVVNDGSKDRTSEIAHEFETKYPDVFRVIDKQNGNYGSCINVALPKIIGKYVKILDADDSFESSNLIAYLKYLENSDCELVLNAYNEVDAHNQVKYQFKYEISAYDDSPIETVLRKYRYIPMHTIAYRSSIFRDFPYHQTESVSYTDTQWSILPLVRVKSVRYFSDTVYRYLVERTGRTMESSAQIRNAWMYADIGLETAAQYVIMRAELSGEKKCLMDCRVASLSSVIYRLVGIEYRNKVRNVNLEDYDLRLKSISQEFYDKVGVVSKRYGWLLSCRYVKDWRSHNLVGSLRLVMVSWWVLAVRTLLRIKGLMING